MLWKNHNRISLAAAVYHLCPGWLGPWIGLICVELWGLVQVQTSGSSGGIRVTVSSVVASRSNAAVVMPAAPVSSSHSEDWPLPSAARPSELTGIVPVCIKASQGRMAVESETIGDIREVGDRAADFSPTHNLILEPWVIVY